MRIPIEVADHPERFREPRGPYGRFHGTDDSRNPIGYRADRFTIPSDRQNRGLGREDDEPQPTSAHGAYEKRVGRNEETRAHAASPPVENRVLPNEQAEDSEGEWKHRYLRLLADFENYRRKTQEEKSRQAEMGKDAVLEDIFPIIDHMENAIQAAREADEHNGIMEGLDLVRRAFLNALQKHGVERIATVGESFDPCVHEAVATMKNDQHPDNTVIQEVRNGFARGNKLLRPARVIVSQ